MRVRMLLILVVILIAFTFGGCEPAEKTNEQVEDVKPTLQEYTSAYPFEVIFYVPSSRYYYVQQLEGEVTSESADEIVKELYSLEAWKEMGGTLGNVVIFDNTVKLVKGERPGLDERCAAEYLRRESVIQIGDEKYPFEPARE